MLLERIGGVWTLVGLTAIASCADQDDARAIDAPGLGAPSTDGSAAAGERAAPPTAMTDRGGQAGAPPRGASASTSGGDSLASAEAAGAPIASIAGADGSSEGGRADSGVGGQAAAPDGRLLSSLSNDEAERVCDDLVGVPNGSVTDPTYRRCLVPLSYHEVCDATVDDYRRCFVNQACDAFDAKCPQILDAPDRLSGAWAQGEENGEPIDLRWGTFTSRYQTPEDGGELFATFGFGRGRVDIFGSITSGEYHGMFALPDDPEHWSCLADVQPTFLFESELQTGHAELIGMRATGITKLPACGAPSGAPVHLEVAPSCDDRYCTLPTGDYFPHQQLILVRAGGDDPGEATQPAPDIRVTTQVLKLSSSLLRDWSGTGSVVCGGGGSVTFVTTTESLGGPFSQSRTQGVVDLDWLASGALSCPDAAGDGSLQATVGGLE